MPGHGADDNYIHTDGNVLHRFRLCAEILRQIRLVSTTTGTAPLCHASVRYRSSRAGLKSWLSEVKTNTVSKLAATACSTFPALSLLRREKEILLILNFSNQFLVFATNTVFRLHS
jgi:hypothetical protein